MGPLLVSSGDSRDIPRSYTDGGASMGPLLVSSGDCRSRSEIRAIARGFNGAAAGEQRRHR